MPPSSSTYSARISPEYRLRIAVLALSVALGFAGAVIVVTLPWPPPARLALLLGWAAGMLLRVAQQRRAFRSVRAYVIHPGGDVEVVSADGRATSARLVDGTTVFAGLAWLRFGTARGRRWGELVRAPRGGGKRLKNKDWRRLQVICRHLGAC